MNKTGSCWKVFSPNTALWVPPRMKALSTTFSSCIQSRCLFPAHPMPLLRWPSPHKRSRTTTALSRLPLSSQKGNWPCEILGEAFLIAASPLGRHRPLVNSNAFSSLRQSTWHEMIWEAVTVRAEQKNEADGLACMRTYEDRATLGSQVEVTEMCCSWAGRFQGQRLRWSSFCASKSAVTISSLFLWN